MKKRLDKPLTVWYIRYVEWLRDKRDNDKVFTEESSVLVRLHSGYDTLQIPCHTIQQKHFLT